MEGHSSAPDSRAVQENYQEQNDELNFICQQDKLDSNYANYIASPVSNSTTLYLASKETAL